MSGMQWDRISQGKAACADQPQNLSPTLHEMRWQGADTKGRQLRRPFALIRFQCG